MIILYTAGPNFGLPDPSPFVSKAEILLKMSGLPYQTRPANFSKAPKRKIPYVEIDGRLMGDSTLIRFHLEDRHGVDFDKGLSDSEKSTAWAFEKMCENHLYWALLHARWMNPDNFAKGPRVFFKDIPAPIRPLIVAMIRRSVKSSLYGHGFGRHSTGEIERLGAKDIGAVSAFLAGKPWLMGDRPCGADAAVWSMVTGILCPLFDTPLRTAAEGHANLRAYRDRGMARWFPDLAANAA